MPTTLRGIWQFLVKVLTPMTRSLFLVLIASLFFFVVCHFAFEANKHYYHNGNREINWSRQSSENVTSHQWYF
jgi:hypothetical protein